MIALTSCVFSKERLKPVTPGSKYDAVIVFNNIEVTMTPGKSISYQVSGNEAAKSKLEIGIEDDALIVKADGLKGSDRLSINLTGPVPESITTFNSSAFVLDGSAEVDFFELGAWNSSRISINRNIIAKKVSVSSSNNGHIDIKSVITDSMKIEAANNAVVVVAGRVRNFSKNVMNGAVVDTTGLSEGLSAFM